jgi:hypothetical protein
VSQEDNDRKRAAGQEAKWTADTLGAIMSTAEGRWWMAEFLDHCNLFGSTYRHDGDALGAAWRDGKADAGRYVFTQIDEHVPDLYQRMMRERRARLERARAKAEEARKKAEAEIVPANVDPLDRLLDEQAARYSKASEG